MNFYPPPPTITAEVYVRISDELRCDGQETEWRGGSALPFSGIFLEGPTTDDKGNLFITDIPYGRILQVDAEKNITECARWDGEPNGLVIREDGQFVVADYKQVSSQVSRRSKSQLIQQSGLDALRPINGQGHAFSNAPQPGAFQRAK